MLFNDIRSLVATRNKIFLKLFIDAFHNRLLQPLSRCGGRSDNDFEDSSIINKRRTTEELQRNISTAELAFATGMNMRQNGDEAVAKLVTKATTRPTRAQRILISWKMTKNKQPSYFLEQAVPLLISSNIIHHLHNFLQVKHHGL